MRITQETDYAFRICGHLAKNEKQVVGAPTIATEESIPERFTLRILRKLNLAGITKAKRGATGGYTLNRPKEEISLYDIIIAVDGPIVINRCLGSDNPICSRSEVSEECYNKCYFHRSLSEIQDIVVEKFKDCTLDKYL